MTIFEKVPRFCKLTISSTSSVTAKTYSIVSFNVFAFVFGQLLAFAGVFLIFIAAFIGKSISDVIFYVIALMLISTLFGLYFMYCLFFSPFISFDMLRGTFSVKGKGFLSKKLVEGKLSEVTAVQVVPVYIDSVDLATPWYSITLSILQQEDITICSFKNKHSAEKLARKLARKLGIQLSC
jgi:hypothetical protein